MALNYPDIIGEYTFAPQRFEVNGLQYVGILDPPAIKSGEVTQLQVYLQSVIDVPLKATIKISLPQSGFFRGQPILTTPETNIALELEPAEVGRLTIPLTTTEKAVEGRQAVELELEAQSEKRANRIRNPRSNPVKVPLLDNLVGLNLIRVLGADYQIQNRKKASFSVTLAKRGGGSGEVQNSPFGDVPVQRRYQQLWTRDMAELLHKAQAEVNTGRIRIIDELKVEPVFTVLYAESTERFADAGLPLRVGEAIALGKLLTYTTHFFLGQAGLQDGLLCPIWERARANKHTTNNAVELLRYVGYKHVVRLAAALSFGLIAETAGHHLWPERERQEVISYIATALDEGNSLMADFLYVPLMLGALKVVARVRLPDEDVYQTLQLIQQARQARPDILLDDDMVEANKLFKQLLSQTRGKAKT